MKRISILFFVASFFIMKLGAQVTIGSVYPPDRNALLELRQNADNSSSKGFLLPRVALVDITSAAPMDDFVHGMVVYNTAFGQGNLAPGFYYCDGIRWVRLNPAEDVIIPSEPWIDAQTGDGAVSNAQSIYQGGQVAIGQNAGASDDAQLEVTSSDKGILIPRLDKIQRDAIGTPSESLLIWNTDESCFNFWKNGKWRSLCGDLGEAEIVITTPDCTAMEIEGTYKVGVPVTSGNYIQLTLQVIEPGSYIIEGQTAKGFFFQRSGTFTIAGIYTIQLPAIGTPKESGVWSCSLSLNGSAFIPPCSKLVTVAPADVQFTFDPSYIISNLLLHK